MGLLQITKRPMDTNLWHFGRHAVSLAGNWCLAFWFLLSSNFCCIDVKMPGTKAGSSNSAWIEHLKECASEYHNQKKQDKPPRKKPDKKEQSKASKTREVAGEERKEKAKSRQLNKATTQTLKRNTDASKAHQKEATKPKQKAVRERLNNEVGHTAANKNDDAVARAHKTIIACRKDMRKSWATSTKRTQWQQQWQQSEGRQAGGRCS